MEEEVVNKYDRQVTKHLLLKKSIIQVRLWGEHGQRSIGQTSVAVIGSSALATEILKSLVLAGIDNYKIFDDAKVQESDTGNNFFVTQDDLQKQRGEVVTKYLNVSDCYHAQNNKFQELNPLVNGSFTCRSFNTSSSLTALNDFSLVVGVRLSMDLAEYIGNYLYKRNIPFVWTTSVGMVGYFRLSFKEHEILHDHREEPPHDFRFV